MFSSQQIPESKYYLNNINYHNQTNEPKHSPSLPEVFWKTTGKNACSSEEKWTLLCAILSNIYGNDVRAENYKTHFTNGSIHNPLLSSGASDVVDALFDHIFLMKVVNNPQKLTELGVYQTEECHSHAEFLNDVSIEGKLQDINTAKELLKIMESYETISMNLDQKTTFDSLKWLLTLESEKERFILHDYRVFVFMGDLFELKRTFCQYHKLRNETEIDTYLTRIDKIPEYLSQLEAVLGIQEENKFLPPNSSVERVLTVLQSFTTYNLEEHPFYNRLFSALESLDIEASKKSFYLKELEIKINSLQSAFNRLIGKFKQLEKLELKDLGVCNLPFDGIDYYCHKLKENTTTNLTPEQIHRFGLDEVERIDWEIRQLLKNFGLNDNQGSLGSLIQQFDEEIADYYEDSDQGRLDLLDDCSKILKRCREELNSFFFNTPQNAVKIKTIPENEQRGMPVAYYSLPSTDGSRVGTIFLNTENMGSFPKYRLETLIVHEGEPGHHFHFSEIFESKTLPAIMKSLIIFASTEGWGLYVERLALENNFFSTEFQKLGHLKDELFRAVRLVLDTGIHYYGWTKEEAVEYMKTHTGFDSNFVNNEVDRYLIMPGQACSYKIGQKILLDLRDELMQNNTENEFLKKFHKAFLEVGQVPLDILQKTMRTKLMQNPRI